MPFLDEIVDRLVAQGVGVRKVNIFASSDANIPSGDGPYLTIYETGGSGSSRTQDDRATERPTAQIAVRAKGYIFSRAMCKLAYDALGGANGLHNVTLSGTRYLSINARQNPTDVGDDNAGRAMTVFNIDAEKAPS